VDIIRNLDGAAKKRMLDSAHGLDRVMLLLIFETGLDVEDLIELRISSIDFEGGFIQLSGGEQRKVSSQTLEELKGYLDKRPNQAFLFEGRCGKPITAKWRRCVLEKLLQREKLKG